METTLTPGPDNGVHILTAINAVMADLDAVGKDHKQTEGRRYNYRAADDVVNAVSPLFARHGIVMAPHQTTAGDPITWQAKSGRTDALSYWTFTFTLYAIADGSSITGQVIASGPGLVPQASGAAMSYALKNFLSAALLIPFDDPTTDVDSPAHTQAVAAAEAERATTWETLGWRTEADHGARRQKLIARMRDLSVDQLADTKRMFAQQRWADPNTGAKITLWVPTGPDAGGKGQLAAVIPKRQMEAAESFLYGAEPWGSPGAALQRAVDEDDRTQRVLNETIGLVKGAAEGILDGGQPAGIEAGDITGAAKAARVSLRQVATAATELNDGAHVPDVAAIVADQTLAADVMDWINQQNGDA